MPHIIKIMTLNINAIASHTKTRMLEDLLRRQDIDIALLQETTIHNNHTLRGYNTYASNGTDQRGTTIVAKEGINITDVKRIPTGRAITIQYNEMWIINIYAPSGAEKRKEREHFFSTEIAHILPTTHTDLIIAGDFNCILNKTETTGNACHSRALTTLVQGLGLRDGWNNTARKGGYTHYAKHSATRLDRIYISERIASLKTGIETTPVAFTDHLAVTIRIATTTPPPTRGKGLWKMNTQLLTDKTFRTQIATEWRSWQTHTHYFPNKNMWWNRYVKRKLKMAFIIEGTEQK
jgi:exonuclease III